MDPLFACPPRGGPAVTLPDELSAEAMVVCHACRQPHATWPVFTQQTARPRTSPDAPISSTSHQGRFQMACIRFETPSPCTVCGSSRGALPASANDASIVQCAICDQELGRLGELRQELSLQARRCGRAPNPDVSRPVPAVIMRR